MDRLDRKILSVLQHNARASLQDIGAAVGLAVVFRPDAENNSLAVAAVTTAAGTPTMQPVRRDTYRKGLSVVGAITYDKVSVGYDLGKLWVTNVHA